MSFSSSISELLPTLTSSVGAEAPLTTSTTAGAQTTIFAPAATSLSSAFSVSSPVIVVPVTSSIRPAVVPAAPLQPFRPGNPTELIPSSMPTLDLTPFLSPSSNNSNTGTAGSTTDGANNPASLTNQKGPNGLSISNIYCIVLGVLLASFFLGFLVFVVRMKLRNNKQKSNSDEDFNTEDADRLVADDAQDRLEKDLISPTSDLSPIVREEEKTIVVIKP